MYSGQYQILGRLFSTKLFHHLTRNGGDNLFARVAQKLLNSKELSESTNLDVLESLYLITDHYYRHEYFYKNTILNKILLGRHSLNTSVALNELAVEGSIADFVLVNGEATVYEIKSEIDNLDRLNDQIANYYKAFPKVFVVTYEANLKKIGKVVNNKNVGLLVLNKNNRLSEIRAAVEDSSKLSAEAIYKILRKREYENVILNHFGELPEVSSVMYYRECLKQVKKIELVDFYCSAILELKQRDIAHKREFTEFVPYEMRYPIYFSKLRRVDYLKLDEFLSADYGGL